MALTIAILGISCAVGGDVGSQCDVDPEVERIIGIDRRPPSPVPEKCTYVAATGSLKTVLVEHAVDLAVYLSPFPSGAVAAEPPSEPLEAFLSGCDAARVRGVVVASGARLYKAPDGEALPATEGAALAARGDALAAPDRAREERVARFAREHPDTRVAICRFAPVTGPGTKGPANLFLSGRRLPGLHGSDPRLQFLHREDAGMAVFRLLKTGQTGVFNVAPDDALSLMDLSRCLKRPVKRYAPGFAQAVSGPGRLLGLHHLTGIHAGLLPLLSSRTVIANKKLKRDVGFRFKYASDGAITDADRT